MPAPDVWGRFSLDPRHPANAHLRASDADRDVVQVVLGEAYAEGRITSDELDERADATHATKTLGELPALLADLVPSDGIVRAGGGSSVSLRAEAEQRYLAMRRQALRSFLLPTLICWFVFLAVAFADGELDQFPWPVFVMIGTGWRWVKLTTSRDDSIDDIQRRLEKRRRRLAEAQERAARRAFPPSYPPPPAGPRG